MRSLIIFILSILIWSQGFSQTTKPVSLEDCLSAAISSHPLNQNRIFLQNSLSKQNEILDKNKLPMIIWNTQARIQSESIKLEIDNPMFPSIEIPLYSAQTSLDLNYTIYDGKRIDHQKNLNQASNASMQSKLEAEIESIKADVVKSFLTILMLGEKEKILLNTLERIRNNISMMESAIANGVLNKSDLLQLQVKEKEIENVIEANKFDRNSAIALLKNICSLEFDENAEFEIPSPGEILIDQQIFRKEFDLITNEQKVIAQKQQMTNLKNKAIIQAFATTGIGYPNPLNFFDDEVSPYAIGGIRCAWNFIDYGKSKKEKQLLKIQNEILEVQKMNLTKGINDQNDRFVNGIAKYQQLIEGESKLIEMREEISSLQKNKLQKGVILPSEYINTINDIIDAKLKKSNYVLQLISLKLEYLLIKGKL